MGLPKNHPINCEDLTGQTFNKIFVVCKTSPWVSAKFGCRRARWLCRCRCGTEFETFASSLKSGHTKSCGCGRLNPFTSENNVFLDYKGSARRRNIPFELTRDQLVCIASGICNYCGAVPAIIEKKPSGTFIHNGIDRQDNSVGYILGNCVPCCTLCNNMKHALGEQEFLVHIEKIHRWQEG